MSRSPLPVSNGAKTTAESEPMSATIEQLPVKPAPAMQQTEVPIRRTRGRLSRNTLETLGKVLDVFYDDVRKEGVPDRFKDLLRQFEERKDKGQN
jgi:Anti-sigma factor NepR